ncbi:MAG TPA: PTS sugar transporter subunit IIA [Gemmatales bacterium]|nr:PTS sugar transporter subunit IIA [Gemmatales bacterium]HMP60988.1 PTS sugar transporter subunit IIA [Gemmatales bacterium]
MNPEILDLAQAAAMLNRDARDVTKLASRGYLPARRVGDQWRFSRTELAHWLEQHMHGLSEIELRALENAQTSSPDELVLARHLVLDAIAVPLPARTKRSVLQELLSLAENSGCVYDPDTILAALIQREELASTGTEAGVAFPHAHRPLPQALGDTVIGFGRTSSGLPFGAPHGILTDLYFLILSTDSKTHLQILARLARLALRPDFLSSLRAAETAVAAYDVILDAERQLLQV